MIVQNCFGETSLAVQWLRLCASTAGGVGSILGWRTKILYAAWYSQTTKNVLKIVLGIDSAPLSNFSCIWVYLSVLPVLVMVRRFFIFRSVLLFYASQMLVGSENEKWTYTQFIHSWQFTHVLLLFLRRDTPLYALLTMVGCIPLFCFSPDVWLFLLVSYTEIVVAWAVIYLRKCSLIKGHTTKIPNPIYSPNQWLLVFVCSVTP